LEKPLAPPAPFWQFSQMSNDKPAHPSVPMKAELEQRFNAKIITYDHGNNDHRPGGMCSCCGSGPDAQPEWREEPWYVYRGGLCDSDGVYYSMLCEGCLEEFTFELEQRPGTLRDEMSKVVNELLGDDIDGAQAMMDDYEVLDPEEFDFE